MTFFLMTASQAQWVEVVQAHGWVRKGEESSRIVCPGVYSKSYTISACDIGWIPGADSGRLIELSVYCIPQEDKIIGVNRGEGHRHERPEQVLS